jgi:hypothetical protein
LKQLGPGLGMQDASLVSLNAEIMQVMRSCSIRVASRKASISAFSARMAMMRY